MLPSLDVALRCPVAVEAVWAADFLSGGASIGILTKRITCMIRIKGIVSCGSTVMHLLFCQTFSTSHGSTHSLRSSFEYGVLVQNSMAYGQ